MPRRSRRVAARARQRARRPAGAARAASSPRSPATLGADRRALQRRRRARSRAHRDAAGARGARGRRRRASGPPRPVRRRRRRRAADRRRASPYTIFTPFHRTWLAAPRRAVAPARRARCRRCHRASRRAASRRSPRSAWTQDVADPRRAAASARARDRRAAAIHRREPARRAHPEQTSRAVAVPALRLHLPARARGGRPTARPDAFRRQLCWRDFYAHVLLHHPGNARREHQQRYRGRCAGAAPPTRFDAWCEGGRASRSSTPACASCGARAGCTTARGWSSARS